MSQTYTTRMTLVFPVPAINQQAAASIERIVVTEAGQAFPLPTAVDPALVAQYAPEWNLAAANERDSLAAEKAELTATLETRTQERDAEKAEKESALAEVATLTEQLATATAERDDALHAKDAAEFDLVAVGNERDAALAEVERLKAELEALKNPVDTQGFPILYPSQLRRMLRRSGISKQMVADAIASIPDDLMRGDAEDLWEYSTTFERTNPLVTMLGAAMGLSNTDIDTLWRAAGAIQ